MFDPNDPANPSTTTIPVKLELESDNTMKTTIGLRLSPFPFVKIYGDYNIANYNSLNAGLAIGF